MKQLKGMNMSSYDELMKAFASIQVSEQPQVEYRLYYNEQGQIYLGAQTKNDYPEGDNFVQVTKDEYQNYNDYWVKDKQLVKIDKRPKHRVQLKVKDSGKATVKGHASIPLMDNETYSDIVYYGKD
jgi:hypothetical protein